MEQRYWEQFMKSGGVCDYLGYKMEVYGHDQGRDTGQEEQKTQCNAEAAMIPMYSQDNDIA